MMRQYDLLTISAYKSYFQDIVARATFLNSFFYTYTQLTDANRSTTAGTFLCLEPYENRINGHRNDNIQGQRKGLFVIAKSIKSHMDLDKAHAECELLAYKVVGQIKRDARERKLICEIDNFSGHGTDMITANNFAGYAIEFNFWAPINRFMTWEEEDWNESE